MCTQFLYWCHAEFSLIELPVEKILSLRRIYFNGVYIDSLIVDQITTTSSSEFRIGGSNTYSFDFMGLIEEVSLWSKSLTQEEIHNYINCYINYC